MSRERLLLWSAPCLPGVHLPLFAAADEGLDVELVESGPGAERVRMLAGGEGDFLLTATLYHLQALAEAGPGGLPVRAVAVVHRRSPVAAMVRAEGPLRQPGDLVGRRLGAPVGRQMGWLAAELVASLPGPVETVDLLPSQAYPALARGEIDLVADFDELLPFDRRRAGVALRAVPAGPPVYTSALLAAAGVGPERVARMVDALRASFSRQQAEPARGAASLCARYRGVEPADAVESWQRLRPYLGPGPLLGAGEVAGWGRTLAWAAAVHGVESVSVEGVVGERAAVG